MSRYKLFAWILFGVLVGFMLAMMIPQASAEDYEPWELMPGTLATIDAIEAGIVLIELRVPDGVWFLHLPFNLFDYPVSEGDRFIWRMTEYEE